MILPRDQYSSAPPPRSKVQDNPTLLVSWWCTGFALAIILVRISGRYVRTERLFREDKIMALSLIPLLARMGLVHVVLIWGTNNAIVESLTPLEIQHREVGSRLVLASRIMYALFIWIAKFTITEFLKRLTSHVWKRTYELGLQFIRWFLIVTFAAVVVATLAECQPFDHYWQVVPDPGSKCRQGEAQLYTMGTADIITDLLIVGFPIPIVLKSAMVVQRKVSLVLLFGLSLILVGITIYRMQGVRVRHSSQQFRSLLASLEILAAAAVSNALVLGSFVRDRGAKKQRFRFGSISGNSSMNRSANAPRRAITAKNWGSDADLVGDLGMRCDPELREKPSGAPRPAPVASPSGVNPDVISYDTVDQGLAIPNGKPGERIQKGLKSPEPVRELHQNGLGELPNTPRRTSFFDVGGLLGNDHTAHKHSRHQSVAEPPICSQDSSTTPNSDPKNEAQRGSRVLLQDIGGLLSPSSQATTPRATTPRPAPEIQHSGLIEALQSTPPSTAGQTSRPPRQREGSPGLQDVGGLLS